MQQRQGGKNGKDKSEKLTESKLEGDWTMCLDYTALIESGMLGDDTPEIFDMIDLSKRDLSVELDVSFEEGEMEIAPDGMVDFMEEYLDAIMEWMAEDDNIYELIAVSSGEYTAEEYKSLCDQQGVSKSQLISMMEDELPDAEDIVGDMDTKILCYELDGNKLYTWDEEDEKDEESYYQFTYADDVITVTKVVEDGDSTKLDDGAFTIEKK